MFLPRSGATTSSKTSRTCPRRARRGQRPRCPGRSRFRPRAGRPFRHDSSRPGSRACPRPRSSAGCRGADRAAQPVAEVSRTPSPTPASSAATSLETERVFCTRLSVGRWCRDRSLLLRSELDEALAYAARGDAISPSSTVRPVLAEGAARSADALAAPLPERRRRTRGADRASRAGDPVSDPLIQGPRFFTSSPGESRPRRRAPTGCPAPSTLDRTRSRQSARRSPFARRCICRSWLLDLASSRRAGAAS